MYLKCSVSGCKNTRQDAVLHKFPTNAKSLHKWLQFLPDNENLRTTPYKNQFVCQRHFEKRYLAANSRLLAHACPTLFTEREISNGVPDTNNENIDPQVEHNYSRKRHCDHNYSKDWSLEEVPCKKKALDVHSSNATMQDETHASTSTHGVDVEKSTVPTITVPCKKKSLALHTSSGMQDEPHASTSTHEVDVQISTPTTITDLAKPSGIPGEQDELCAQSNLRVGVRSKSPTNTETVAMSTTPTTSRKTCARSNLRVEAQVEVQSKSPTTTETVAMSTTPTTSRKTCARSNLRVEVRSKSPTTTETVARCTTPTTSRKTSRQRIIKKLKNLTPMCKIIYKEYNRVKHQADFHKRAKRALFMSKKYSFEKMAKNLNPYAKKFIEMQLNLSTKKKKGRRFSLDEKLIALAIMKQSPKCYRFLHKIFILPSSSTLNKMVSRLNIEAGINQQFFKLMKKEVDSWVDTKKYCSILFDEMSLGLGLAYDSKNDKINGFVNLDERKGRYADHVLVFMVRGAVHKWQQTVAYYFCEGATSGPELKKILKDVVAAVSQTGLKPIVLSCDQGTAFQSALNRLREDTRREQLLQNEQPDCTILIAGIKLNVIFDPSHLIKGIRNNFLDKDIKYEGKISTWKDIIDVYKTDSNHTQTRILHKLNDEHVIPEKVKKMKVKNCVKVLSKTMAAALSYTSQFSHYIDGTPVSKTLENTAETVSFFDDLFDSVNGAAVSLKKAKGKALRTAVQETSKHHEFWNGAISRLKKTRFVTKDGHEKSVPTLKNFISTLESYMKLWQVFKNLELKIMRPRYFNTDPIENFFGQVRAYNYRNTDPTCHNFIATYKSLTITRVIQFHSESYNCEDDAADQMLTIKELFNEDETEKKDVPCQPLTHDIEPKMSTEVVEQARKERLNTHSNTYVTGWVIRKILEKYPCGQCRKSITSNENETIHNWISHREYKECKNNKKLIYPSEKAVRYFSTILKSTNDFLEGNAHETNLLQKIIEKIELENSIKLVDCTEHEGSINKYFMVITIRFGVFNWCNVINRILKGIDVCRLGKDIPVLQKLALVKYQKKLKNKSFNK